MEMHKIIDDLLLELTSLSEIDLFTSFSELERFSKDSYDYSPILADELKDCRADLVVRPRSIDAVRAVASAC